MLHKHHANCLDNDRPDAQLATAFLQPDTETQEAGKGFEPIAGSHHLPQGPLQQFEQHLMLWTGQAWSSD